MRGSQSFITVALILAGISAYSLASATMHSIHQVRVRSRVRNRARGTAAEPRSSDLDLRIRALSAASRLADDTRVSWFIKLVMPIATKLDSRGYRDAESSRSAGLDERFPGDRLLKTKIVCAELVTVAIGVFLIGSPLLEAVICLIGGAVVGFRFPSWAIRRSAAKRIARCVADLPEMIDMIAMGSEAGLSFDGASALYCERYDGPLGREMERVASMCRAGSMSREQALLDLADRLKCEPVGRFVSGTTQSLKLGAPLADMLSTQADDARRAYRAQLEEQIAKAPVKMLIPMGTLILPAMLLLVLGPVVVSMSSGVGV